MPGAEAESATTSSVMRVRLVLGAVFQPALFALLLFSPPGRFVWREAWMLMAISLVATIVSLIVLARTNPTLLLERFKPPVQRGQPRADKIAVLVFIAAFLGAIRFIPFDVFALHVLPAPGTFMARVGLLVLLVGWWIATRASQVNAFAVPVVKSQADRHQHVVDSGPYAWVRHPMYAGTGLVLLGMPLWLGSWAGVLAACVPIAVLIVRIGIEERFLRRELAGYADYTARVPSRLVPGVW